MKRKYNIPRLLEAEFTVPANNKLLTMKERQLEELGAMDPELLLGEWKNWVKKRLVARLVKKPVKKA